VEVREEGPRKLKYYKIPNIPMAAEAYYASDSRHIIAQVQDPDAVRNKSTDGGEPYMSDLKGGNVKRLINHLYYDAEISASPDGKRLLFARALGEGFMSETSTPMSWTFPRSTSGRRTTRASAE